MASDEPGASTPPVLIIWPLLTAIAVPLVVLLLGPGCRPGTSASRPATSATSNILLAALATPVLLGIWVCLVYEIVSFRQRGAALEDGPPLKGHARTQVLWVAATAVIVLGLGVYGTTELVGSAKGAGGGQGPDPLAVPHGRGPALQVQVIGQQWAWTFRYPPTAESRRRTLRSRTTRWWNCT